MGHPGPRRTPSEKGILTVTTPAKKCRFMNLLTRVKLPEGQGCFLRWHRDWKSRFSRALFWRDHHFRYPDFGQNQSAPVVIFWRAQPGICGLVPARGGFGWRRRGSGGRDGVGGRRDALSAGAREAVVPQLPTSTASCRKLLPTSQRIILSDLIREERLRMPDEMNLSFGPGVSELSSLKSIEDSDILGNTQERNASLDLCK